MKGGEEMADFEIIDVSGCMNSWSAIGVEEEDQFSHLLQKDVPNTYN